jgi:predicted membrane protein (TIGR00267 family)
MPSGNFFSELKEYNALVNIDQIARRYFVINAFDGVLTTLGILLGAFLAGVKEPNIVISATIGAAIAMGISGIWGAYLTENAERKKELIELELMLHTKLKKTKFGRATKAAGVILAFVDAIASFVPTIIIVLPFFFIWLIPNTSVAYYSAFGLSLAILAALGVFLSTISKENILISIFKMITAGIVCGVVLFVLENLL